MFSLLISILSSSPMTFLLLNQWLLIRTHLSCPISHMTPLETPSCGFLAPHSSPVPPSCLAEHIFVTLQAPNLTNAQDLVWITNTAVATWNKCNIEKLTVVDENDQCIKSHKFIMILKKKSLTGNLEVARAPTQNRLPKKIKGKNQTLSFLFRFISGQSQWGKVLYRRITGNKCRKNDRNGQLILNE